MTKPTLRDATNDPPAPPAPRARRRPRWDPPAWLSKTGKAAFRRIVLDLEPDLLTRSDVPELALLAEAYAVAQHAAKAMRGPGNEPVILEVDAVHGGHLRKSPAWQVFNQATARFDALARNFGLSPAARIRLELPAGAPLGDEQDDDEDLEDAL